jgi:type II secretory pathway pseudopilin PulG
MPGPRREQGFTYLGLLILVSIIGLAGAAALKVDALLRRAEAERDLLEVGAAFSEALRSYAAATPRGQSTRPPGLQDLLKDPRFPGVRRHLRKLFVDPVTGKGEWGIVYAGEHTGVLAVHSLSSAQPLKLANFDARFSGFENSKHISDWKFTASGLGVLERGEAIAIGGRSPPPGDGDPLAPRDPPPAPGFPDSRDPPAAQPQPQGAAQGSTQERAQGATQERSQEAAGAPEAAAPDPNAS